MEFHRTEFGILYQSQDPPLTPQPQWRGWQLVRMCPQWQRVQYRRDSPAMFATMQGGDKIMGEQKEGASLHQVVKQLSIIYSKLTPMSTSSQNVNMFASNLEKEIRKRFKNCGCTNKYFRFAHLLDPDIKGDILKEFGIFERTVEDAREMWRKYDPTPDPDVGQEHDLAEGVDESSIDPLERLKKRRRTAENQNLAVASANSRFDAEIERYLNLPLDDCDDPIASWKENKGSFFLLRNLAAEILSISASSSSSERAFSVGTRVNSLMRWMPLTPHSSERSRMSSTSLESIRIQTAPRRVKVTVRRKLTLMRMLIRSMREVDKSFVWLVICICIIINWFK